MALVCPRCGQPAPRENARFCPRDGSPFVEREPDVDRILGQVFQGRYAVKRRIGQGGMATVYECEQQPLGRRVALKLLHKGVATDAEMTKRFMLEARATATLQSPHAVRVIEFDRTPRGAFYLVMEFLDGVSLRERLETVERLSVGETVRILRAVGETLAEAHSKGIVHRDMKPDNVFLAITDKDPAFVKVLDFGMARAPLLANSCLTADGELLGTPAYMSPEMVMGEVVDARADIFALGVMMYEMLAGVRPFKETDAFELMHALIQKKPESIRAVAPDVEVPRPLHRLMWRCLTKDREQRPADGAAFVADLDRVMRQVAAGVDTERMKPLHVTGMGLCGGENSAKILANATSGWKSMSPVLLKTDRRSGSSGPAGPSEHEFPPTAEVLRVVQRDRDDTTPRGDVSEVDEVSLDLARTSRMPMAFAGAALLVALVALLAWALGGERAPVEASGAAAVAGAAPAAAVSSVSITVVSEPAGAHVRLAGVDLGVTPLQLAVPRAEAAVLFTVSLAGYLDQTATTVPNDAQMVHVVLQPAPR